MKKKAYLSLLIVYLIISFLSHELYLTKKVNLITALFIQGILTMIATIIILKKFDKKN